MWQQGTPRLVGFLAKRRILVPTAANRGLTLKALCDLDPRLVSSTIADGITIQRYRRGVKTCENSFRNREG